jgi:hypothetical protein
MRPSFMCTDPGSCDGFVALALLLLGGAAGLVVAFVWGVWYGVSRRLLHAGAGRVGANVAGLAGGLGPPLLAAALARSGLFAFDPAILALAVAPFASLAFGLRTWSLERRERRRAAV